MKRIGLIFLTLLLVGCAHSVPRNKANACMLLSEKDQWREPLEKSALKWGIPAHTILSIIYHESKFVPDALPPRKSWYELGFIGRRISSAYGYSQALDGTWQEYKRETRNWSADRTSFRDSVDFIGWYLYRAVRALEISPHNAYHLYLAYHQGIYGYRKKRFLKKPAIMRYARKVQDTAVSYKDQMNSCSLNSYQDLASVNFHE